MAEGTIAVGSCRGAKRWDSIPTPGRTHVDLQRRSRGGSGDEDGREWEEGFLLDSTEISLQAGQGGEVLRVVSC